MISSSVQISPSKRNRNITSASNTMVSMSDDGVGKKLKPKKKTTTTATTLDDSISSLSSSKSRKDKSSSLDDSMSSIASKSKRDKSSSLKDSKTSISSKNKKVRKSEPTSKAFKNSQANAVIDALHSSYNGSMSLSESFMSDSDNSDDEIYKTPRQSLNSPKGKNKRIVSAATVRANIHDNYESPKTSPKRSVVSKYPTTPTNKGKKSTTTAKTIRGKVITSDSFNGSCPDFYTNDNTFHVKEFGVSPRSKQSKKVIIPNPKDPTKIKTTFLEDCSDSSDSEHEKERKRMIKKSKKLAQEKTAAKEAAAIKENFRATRRRSSLGPCVAPQVAGFSTENSPSTKNGKKSTTSVKVAPLYAKRHHKAATKISSFIRGYIARMRYRIRKLQHQLDTMEKRTMDEIAEVYVDLEMNKQDFEDRAHDRFQKNMKRSDKALTVVEAQELIAKIRAENIDVRERNKSLFSDLEKLKINNERLENANKESNEFMSRLGYHQETIEVEHAKLMKVHTQYEEAVRKHEEQLAIQDGHVAIETKSKNMYNRLLGSILDKLDSYKDRDAQLVEDIYSMAESLESEYGPVVRGEINESNIIKEEKKIKKNKKRVS